MKRTHMKWIVIIVGIIVALLIMHYLRIRNPFGRYFFTEIFTYLLIAVLALIFGPVVGGIVGLLSKYYYTTFSEVFYFHKNVLRIPNLHYNMSNIPFFLFLILLTGLYGFVIGKLFEKKTIKADNTNAVLNTGLFSLLSAGLFIATKMLYGLSVYIYMKLTRPNRSNTLARLMEIPQCLIQGLVIGGISFVIIFFCYKCARLNIPFSYNENNDNKTQSESKFDGGLLSYIGWVILGFIVTVLTLGLCFPWALCMVYGWRINHTTINGRRLKFTGTAISLFGHWLLWILLCIITLGIYSFWLFIALEKWKVKNTTFAD